MKPKIKTIIIVLICAFSMQIVSAQDADKTVTIVVSGSGKTQDDAKQSALRSAIEQAFGAFISSKTEILNDQVIADQIASVANGNIQSFSILNESQLPDGSWGITLKAIVSVNKLTSFVESKGIAVEIKGGLFALNIKQQILNEQAEIQAVSEMVGLLHEPMQISFDYSIKGSEPKSLDAENKNWAIPIEVTATCNQNMDFCANYCIKTLTALSLSDEEVKNYQNLNKQVYKVIINYKRRNRTFFLRKQFSLYVLETLKRQWEFYVGLFSVQYGSNESYKIGGYDLMSGEYLYRDIIRSRNKEDISINFLANGLQAAKFSWDFNTKLEQLEQITGYKVKPRGVVSKFEHGGFVVYEENGHGLVAAITDLVVVQDIYSPSKFETFNSISKTCDELTLNGYSDWFVPREEKDLHALFISLRQLGIGGFNSRNIQERDEYLEDRGFYGKQYNTFGECVGFLARPCRTF